MTAKHYIVWPKNAPKLRGYYIIAARSEKEAIIKFINRQKHTSSSEELNVELHDKHKS